MPGRHAVQRGPAPADAPPPQTDLFGEAGAFGWPPHADFPYNQHGLTVGGVLARDLAASPAPLVITGYASLERVIEWLAACHAGHTSDARPLERVRLLLGHEPHATARVAWPTRRRFPRAIAEHWLNAGVSLRLSGKVVAALELLRAGVLEVRTSGDRPVHAKVYVGGDAVTVGSSNYSRSGLAEQVEANVRFTAAADPSRHADAVRLAERIWAEGEDYAAGFEELLRALLRKVTWQEALARACAELLEGAWAAERGPATDAGGLPLWPSQEQGVAHALWVLEHQGSVLVADATGSGKTRLGAALVRRVMARLWRTGRARTGLAVLLAPPSVLGEWRRAAVAGGAALEGYSQGHLSRADGGVHGGVHATLQKAVRRAQVLVVDEAHNFLRRSNRTRALRGSAADHVLLFTATPISRGPEDLLAVVDLLGADNFNDATLKAVDVLWRRSVQARAVARSRVRRAPAARPRAARARAPRARGRRALRAGARAAPPRGPPVHGAADEGRPQPAGRPGARPLPLADHGPPCRYPTHEAIGYALHETAEDRERATEMREIARGLRGISRLRSRPIVLPPALRAAGWSEARYVEQHLAAAAALAHHDVVAALRSSTARLLEHLCGTEAAVRETPTLAGLALTPAKSGVVERTRAFAGRPPRVDAAGRPPEWIRDPAAHTAAAEDDARRYERIAALARGLSDARERAKADLLVRLLDAHALVLAFDGHVITLHDLAARVRAHPDFRVPARDGGTPREALVVTGGAAGPRRRLYDAFGPESRARGIVALCSDAVSESVNLQGASAVVMLDTPSVIREAEQRIGRVDRMNTAHDVVAAYWPVDAPEFALRSTERLVERHRTVDAYLGSNLPLPASMTGATVPGATVPGASADAPDSARDRGGDRAVGYQEYVAELAAAEARHAARPDLQDAFAPVRALVDPPAALVLPAVYAELRASRARVLAAVGVVRSAAAFGFFAVAGTEYGAPRWVYLDGPAAAPETDLAEVAAALRVRLAPDPPDAPLDDAATALLERLLAHLERHEEALLPRAKQRALAELRWVCARYRRPPAGDHGDGDADGRTSEEGERRAVLDEVLRLAGSHDAPGPADRAALAAWWLRLMHPVRQHHRRGGRRPFQLRHLRRDLLAAPLATAVLRTVRDEALEAPPIERRVAAAIIGVPTATP